MKFIFTLAFLLFASNAYADWQRVYGAADSTLEKYINTSEIRQTGPMNTMRRVWELTNLEKSPATNALSTKNYMEYDCKDRLSRMLETHSYLEFWAKNETLSTSKNSLNFVVWSEIEKDSISEIVFKSVCPSDN
jgi:hypothetical protein